MTDQKATNDRLINELNEQELRLAYFNWIANYKIVALVFSVVPYIALRLL